MGTYLGQNFLIDAKVRSYIADKVLALYHECGCEALIEIGPGKGSITRLISTISPNFFVIEKDDSLVQNLECRVQSNTKLPNLGTLSSKLGTLSSKLGTNIHIIQGDVLDVDVAAVLKDKKLYSSQTLVVGNLPYYITSPILRKFFGYPAKDGTGSQQEFAGGVFMVQDEVGQKLRSDAKKKSYLRWLLNYAYEVKYLKGVPAKCFKPVPKVKSCLIELKIKNGKLPFQDESLQDKKIEWDNLVAFLELFAPFSRKTLGAIQTMLTKRFAKDIEEGGGRLRKGKKDGGKLENGFRYSIPETLQKKRLEELDRTQIQQILK